MGREVAWKPWKDNERHGYVIDLIGEKTVDVELTGRGLAWGIVVRAEDEEVSVSSDGYSCEVYSKKTPVRLWSNYDDEQLPDDQKICIVFEKGLQLEIVLGPPHLIRPLGGAPLLRVFHAWRDSHLSKGIEWVCAVLDEELPWPEAGIAAGLALRAGTLHTAIEARFKRGWPSP